MFSWVRTVDIRDGKALPAIEFGLKIAGYVNDKFGLNVAVQRNVTGMVNQLHWVVIYDSLTSFEEATAATTADEGYQQLLAESAEKELFFANSAVDSLYQSIP
ncbi:MAG: hypothetical protein WA996_15135 [Candidatus Promineifilaceae bacterium]